MKHYILEACVDSAESAIEAAAGGADRLELCANLVIGGTTPGQALYEKIRELTDIRIHVLIRPRSLTSYPAVWPFTGSWGRTAWWRAVFCGTEPWI